MKRMETTNNKTQADISEIIHLQRTVMAAISTNGVFDGKKVVTLLRPIASALFRPVIDEIVSEFRSAWRPCLISCVTLVVYTLFCLFKSTWKTTPSTWSNYYTWSQNVAFVLVTCECVTLTTTNVFGFEGCYRDCFVAFLVISSLLKWDEDCIAFWTQPIVNGRAILSSLRRNRCVVIDTSITTEVQPKHKPKTHTPETETSRAVSVVLGHDEPETTLTNIAGPGGPAALSLELTAAITRSENREKAKAARKAAENAAKNQKSATLASSVDTR